MKIDAIFLVKQEALPQLKQIKVEERLNYILGMHNEDHFMKMFIDMEDYTTLALELNIWLASHIIILEDQAIYEDEKYCIYLFDSVQIRRLVYKSSLIDMTTVIQNEDAQFKEEALKHYHGLIEFLNKAKLNNRALILIMRKL